jgi:hypothetical protein
MFCLDRLLTLLPKTSENNRVKCNRNISLFLYFLLSNDYKGPSWSWSWSYGSWIYNYLCNQCLSPLTLWVRIPLRRGVLDTTLCDKVCQWLMAGWWFSPSTPVSSTDKTDHHDITKILLKVVFSTIKQTNKQTIKWLENLRLKYWKKFKGIKIMLVVYMYLFYVSNWHFVCICITLYNLVSSGNLLESFYAHHGYLKV